MEKEMKLPRNEDAIGWEIDPPDDAEGLELYEHDDSVKSPEIRWRPKNTGTAALSAGSRFPAKTNPARSRAKRASVISVSSGTATGARHERGR